MGDRPAGVIRDLDRRRGWARVEAALACIVGVGIFAVTAAALVLLVLAGMARFWSWATKGSFTDSPVWSWAPGGVAAIAVAAVVVSFLGAFWYFWWGASPQVLAEVEARPVAEGYEVLRNVVEALSIGIGKPAPELYMADDPVPNALSLRSRKRRILVITSGCSELGRDQLEAMCAHELGHLWATDAHWVTSGMVALARAGRLGTLLSWIGTVVVLGVMYVAYEGHSLLWATGLFGLGLLVLGGLSKFLLRKLELGVRRRADEIADVAAVMLAKNPESLGSVCARLAAIDDRVGRTGWRSELMWFELVEVSDPGDGEVSGLNARSRRELVDRAIAAYATANVPVPAIVVALDEGRPAP